MRFLNIRFAPFLAALAIAAGSGSVGLAAADPFDQPDPLFEAQVAALERSGLDTARAVHGIEVQTAIDEARLIAKLESELAGGFGGVWLEPATATLHVGVVSPIGRLTVERLAQEAGLSGSVVVAPVGSSWADLVSIRDVWNRRLGSLLADGKAITLLSPEANAVKVELASTVPAARRSALARSASVGPVELRSSSASKLGLRPLARCRAFAAAKAHCDKPIASGVTIQDAGGKCSSGPAIVKKPLGDNTTETFVLTAGHCINGPGEAWSAYTKGEVKKALGNSVITLSGSDRVDIGVIKVENGEWINAGQTPVDPTVVEWGAAESDPIAVAGQQDPVKNHTTCHSGQSTGTVCGTIIAIDQTVAGVEGLAEVNNLATAAEEGDSGGPFFSKEVAGLMVEGTLVGNREINGVETDIALLERLSFSLERLDDVGQAYELVTTANKARPKCPMPGGEACFYGDSYPATLTGAGTSSDAFTFNAGTVKCNASSYSQTLEEPLPTLELAPSFAECTAFGFVSTTIDANGCKLKPSVTGAFSVGCPEGKAITVTAFNCWVKIGTQTNSGFTSTNTTSATPKPALDLNLAISGLTYTQESKNFPGCSSGTRTDGKLTASITVKGDNGNGEAIGVGRS